MNRFAAHAAAAMTAAFAFSAACFWAGHRIRTGGTR